MCNLQSSQTRSQMSTDPTIAYLRSLAAVRERSKQVYELVVTGRSDHWDWHEDKLQDVVDFCAGLIEVRLPHQYSHERRLIAFREILVGSSAKYPVIPIVIPHGHRTDIKQHIAVGTTFYRVGIA